VTPERWEEIQALFFELAELETEDQAARLDALSSSDPELHAQLKRLLAAHDETGELLGSFEDLISRPGFEEVPEEGRPALADPHKLIGRTVSHYEVVGLLGAGGMGILYKAVDTQLSRTVALKFLPPQWSLDGAFKARFEREARAVAALDHPNVCAIHEIGETDEGQLFIAMAFYDGETVREKIARGSLAVDEAMELAAQAASGLAAAHRAGLVHRDIKPANLMVTEEGVLKILDFGLAKTEETALTESGMVLGTPAYMSPEQTRGEGVDARTDLWSLGVVLYEMLTAQRPFGGKDMAVFHAILHEEPRPPGELRADLPSEMEEMVLRLLSKDPEARYAGAELLSEELAASASALTGAMGLLREIHRRSLWRVLGIYVVGSWLVLLVVDTLAGTLNLPDWAPALALFLLIVGLPIVLATAFVQVGPTGSKALHAEAVELKVAVEDHRRSIAVLPLANRSALEEDQFFVDGIHDDILTRLSQIEGLKVISRTSVMQYRESPPPIREIAGELGVGTVLEGAVQRAGDRVRVNVQLIDAETDRQLWAQTYDEELTAANIFAIQSDIAEQIASALRATLSPELKERIEARPTESLEAYDLYTRGRYLTNRSWSREDLESAANLYRQAIAADPAYALAHVGLAGTYWFRWFLGFLAAEEALPQARAAVERALELDETLAEAHAALGLVLRAELRFKEAERAGLRALKLNPGSADVHQQYGWLLLDLARYEESVREARRAVELDPLSMRNRLGLANILGFARDYDASIVESLRILELEPENARAYYNLAAAYTLNGQHEEGLAAIRRSIELDPEDPLGPPLLAWVYARAGQRDEALKALEQVEEQGPMLKEIAIVYGELGDLDRAFAYLDRAYAEDPGSLTYLRADPTTDSLKDDPRFDELMRKLGLE